MIRSEAEVDAAINDFMQDEVVPYWRSQSPVDSGKYAASVKVVKKAKRGKGKVAATVWYAHFVEYGTGADSKGKDGRKVLTKRGFRLLPKDTPTTADAPGQKTAQHFGGTIGAGGGVQFDGEDE